MFRNGCFSSLQEPEVGFAEGGEFFLPEVRYNLRDHFRILDGDGEVLLLDGFPVHTAELIDLIQQGARFVHPQFLVFRSSVVVDLLQFQLDGEDKIVSAWFFVAGVVVKEAFVIGEPDDGAAPRHQSGVISIESDIVGCLRLVDGYDINRY